MTLAKEMKEAASAKEIVFEQKIHITETEEMIEEEIPLPVQEMFITKAENDGKDLMKFINLSTSLSIVWSYLWLPNPPFCTKNKTSPLSGLNCVESQVQSLTSSHSVRPHNKIRDR